MHPWARTNEHLETQAACERNETAQIPIARPNERSGLRFMMVPEYVSRNDADACRFHFGQFGFPVLSGHARKMKFAHDGQPGLAVEYEIAVVDFDFVATRRDVGTEMEIVRLRCRGLFACVNTQQSRCRR